ncbi:MAG: hypothetical protein D6743_05125 [Calditrichaeota bacterium]|nr:MAG: hypothetical protein D6743_05125 [Calditrichota bacterium]
MAEQNYANHRRLVPMYHFVASFLILALLIGSVVNLIKSFGTSGLYSASLLVVVAVVLAILFYYMRVFPLKAQDRAIRAEENLRHYVLTGKLLDPRLDIRQIIGLRFAGDEEFPELEKRAVAEGLTEDAIKRAIKTWRPDLYRV